VLWDLALAGPRFDASNDIIPHSILGDVEDFVSEAVRRGDLAEVRHKWCLSVLMDV